MASPASVVPDERSVSLARALIVPFKLPGITMTPPTKRGDQEWDAEGGDNRRYLSPEDIRAAIAYVEGRTQRDVEANRQRMDRMDRDVIRTRSDLEAFVGEIERRLRTEIEANRASIGASEERMRREVEALRDRDIARLRQDLDTRDGELEKLRSRVTTLMAYASIAGAGLSLAAYIILHFAFKNIF